MIGACSGGSSPPPPPATFQVLSVTPANGQAVESNLSDAAPGEDAGRVTIRFSDPFDATTVLDASNFVPGTIGVSDEMKLADSVARRTDIPVGRGPRGIAHEPLGGKWVLVANSLDGTVSVIDGEKLAVVQTVSVGFEPWEVAMTPDDPDLGGFAFVTNRADDSVSVLRRKAGSETWAVAAMVPGFDGPEGVMIDYAGGAWVANAGGDTLARLDLGLEGMGPLATIHPHITDTVKVGANPTSVTLEPWTPYETGWTSPPTCVIAAVPGANKVVFVDRAEPSRPTSSTAIPGVREVASFIDQ